MTAFNARALASLVTVAGSALSKRLTVILNALVKSIETEKDPELLEDINDAVRALLSSVSDTDGLTSLMMLLANWYDYAGIQYETLTHFCIGSNTATPRNVWLRSNSSERSVR